MLFQIIIKSVVESLNIVNQVALNLSFCSVFLAIIFQLSLTNTFKTTGSTMYCLCVVSFGLLFYHKLQFIKKILTDTFLCEDICMQILQIRASQCQR